MHRYVLTLLFVSFVCTCGRAQYIDLRTDTAFFNAQLPYLTGWLNEMGLGEAFAISDLVVQERSVRLSLEFRYNDAVTAISSWEQLRKDFDKHSTLRLEERLFYKAQTTLELESSQLKLRIFNFPAVGSDPVFDDLIYFDADLKKLRKKAGFRNEVRGRDTIPPFVLDSALAELLLLPDVRERTQQQRYELNAVLGDSLRAYFARKEVYGKPRMLSTNPPILLVESIKSEVVPAAWLSIQNPYERLTITLDTRFTAAGLELSCIVDGKYGSGIIRPRSAIGFHHMDPKFQKELTVYAAGLTNEVIRPWLLDALKKY